MKWFVAGAMRHLHVHLKRKWHRFLADWAFDRVGHDSSVTHGILVVYEKQLFAGSWRIVNALYNSSRIHNYHQMSFIMVDIESDGSIPGDYSMISFGAVLVNPTLDKTFYGKLRPISERWIPEALAVSGFSRDEVLRFSAPEKVMAEFRDWLKMNASSRPMFISDNNGFDWQLINWYFHHFLGRLKTLS